MALHSMALLDRVAAMCSQLGRKSHICTWQKGNLWDVQEDDLSEEHLEHQEVEMMKDEKDCAILKDH